MKCLITQFSQLPFKNCETVLSSNSFHKSTTLALKNFCPNVPLLFLNNSYLCPRVPLLGANSKNQRRKLYRIYFKLGEIRLLVLRIDLANRPIKRTVKYNTTYARSQKRLI